MTQYLYGDLSPEILAWARDHGGRVDTGDLAKALARREPERFPSWSGLSKALASQTGRMYGCLRLAQGLYKLRDSGKAS